jgi:hypothetical protein
MQRFQWYGVYRTWLERTRWVHLLEKHLTAGISFAVRRVENSRHERLWLRAPDISVVNRKHRNETDENPDSLVNLELERQWSLQSCDLSWLALVLYSWLKGYNSYILPVKTQREWPEAFIVGGTTKQVREHGCLATRRFLSVNALQALSLVTSYEAW